jgi:parallel beta-helix repeat protein
LCGGTYSMSTTAGHAAITVGADNVTVTCAATVLKGPGPVGPSVAPNVGFSVVGRSTVTLRGCTANGFQYGALVKSSSAVMLDTMHLDDNFTDPNAGWVQDSEQGGGVRLEGVTGGTVKSSSFARNWNGVELRSTTGVTVTGNKADHSTNWGALLVASKNNTVSSNDFSWAVRGGLSYPGNWWGVDTRDSAGIVLDAGSSGNTIQNNDAEYGGDGIFLRAVIGSCAGKNKIIGNKTSFSPHNAIESWCDGNTFSGNTASSSTYGLWLGASDSSTVVGNVADGSKVDGISIQNGSDRHGVIRDNTLTNSGRAGLFLGARNYQDSNPPTPQDGNVWNSSQLLVEHNTFSGNTSYDVYIGYSRSVVLASNNLTASKVFAEPSSTALVRTLGSYSGATARTPPTASLASLPLVKAGTAVTFDASASAPSVSGGTLSFTWLMQAAGAQFAGALPPIIYGASAGGSKVTKTLNTPGFYDLDVTVTDGYLGALASRGVTVVPGGVRVGETASLWTAACGDPSDCVGTVFSDDTAGIEGSAVHMKTNAAFNIAMVAPAAKNLALDASAEKKFGFFVKGNAPNNWQFDPPNPPLPQIVLGSPTGTITYQLAAANTSILPNKADGWIYIEVPLAPSASSGWTRTDAGGSLSHVDWIEIHADTWGAGFDLWVDAVSFY